MVNVTAYVRLSKFYEENNAMVSVTGPVRLIKVRYGNNAMVSLTGRLRVTPLMTISPQLWLLPTGSSHADKCRP